MFLTLVRRHNDNELFTWANRLLKNFRKNGKNFTAHYLGYGQFTLDQCKNLINNGKTIVFCFDYTLDKTKKNIVDEIEKNKNAELLWIGAEKDPFDHPRIKCVFWPADMLLQNKEYSMFDQIIKEPSQKRHWISMSLGIRPHRIYMASLLRGMNLDAQGDLRIKTISRAGNRSPLVSEELSRGNNNAPDGIATLENYVKNKWQINETSNISLEAKQGYEKLIQRKWWGSSLFLYSDYMALGFNQNNNALNFDKNLRHLYKDKTLEVVNETRHRDNHVFVTEKFLNAVVGLNLIIMNGPANTVKLLEELGWNSCRNVINHDYDSIKDPIERCEKSIRLNHKLFSDATYCNRVWKDNFKALSDNSKWARTVLYSNILDNCEKESEKLA
jgi:hypothetical protein